MARKSRTQPKQSTDTLKALSKVYKTAIYVRLSAEKDETRDRKTLINQRNLIKNFVDQQMDMEVYDIYMDDEISGTTFDRPEFERMMSDMRAGRINCIVVKDLPTNAEKDKFAADYQVLNRAWNAVSPDPMLSPIQVDYVWLTKVFESVKPTNGGGGLIWAALGPKTMEIVNSNMDVGEVHEDEEILSLDAELIDAFIEKHKGAKNAAKKVEIDLVARIHKHSDDPKFMRLGDKLEKLREQHEQGLINSIEFLKMLLELAREAAQAEKEVVPEEEVDKGKAALTELFNGVKNTNTPVIVERIVTDIDDIVKIVRFDGWQNTTGGRQEVKKALRSVVWVKYKIKDKEVFDKAYSYIEQYY